MASPIKLSHIVLQTKKPRELREWYCQVLGWEIVHENDFISFISYDDKHHRVAFLNPGGLAPREPGERESGDFRAGKGAGLHYMAFTFKSFNELLDTYTLAQGKRYPSVLVHQSWFDDLDVLPRPGQQSGRALDRQFR